ncbi:MAG: leucyl/phenylalanyl-tRNA--protein transferase [Bacteroidetes bacterium]|nr:leucyl/phenylalanyl-tRNA--protein transferase [Bacteroidota bacterium]
MPIYQLTKRIKFPAVENAEASGLLAYGGDLSTKRLIKAYESGIFPWYSKGEPIQWWSPDPRFVLYPDELKVSVSMRQIIRSGKFKISFDRAFEDVIVACQTIRRKDQDDTWITDEMKDSYCILHNEGIAHSVEVWNGKKLVGGLYGISRGSCFCGESMFSLESNASKAGFIELVNRLNQLKFKMIDCQVYTEHLRKLGARSVKREKFIKQLKLSLEDNLIEGKWNNHSAFKQNQKAS